MKQKKEEMSNMRLDGKIAFVVRDKKGNLKKLWNDNRLGKIVLKFCRKYFPQPKTDNIEEFSLGEKLNVYGLRIPYLFGFYAYDMDIHNLIVSAGKAGAASRLNGAGAEAAFTYLGVGIGTTAAAAGDTALESEIVDSGLARAAATCTRVTTTVTNDTAQLDKTWTVSGTKAVTECGILNAAAAGVLLGRQVFTAVNVQAGDSLQMIYKVACS